MAFGAEGFPRKIRKEEIDIPISRLEEIADTLQRRVDGLPPSGHSDPELTGIEEASEFGSPDLGDIVNDVRKRHGGEN